jgi:hypothetical protein
LITNTQAQKNTTRQFNQDQRIKFKGLGKKKILCIMWRLSWCSSVGRAADL